MHKLEFLDLYIFKGLTNLNDGFDSETIKYFSQADFKVLLYNVEQYGLGIYGIEPWKDGEYYDCQVYGSHTNDCTNPAWYKKVFDNYVKEGIDLQYAASYHLPENIRKEFMIYEDL